jgi:hypothetical protein
LASVGPLALKNGSDGVAHYLFDEIWFAGAQIYRAGAPILINMATKPFKRLHVNALFAMLPATK